MWEVVSFNFRMGRCCSDAPIDTKMAVALLEFPYNPFVSTLYWINSAVSKLAAQLWLRRWLLSTSILQRRMTLKFSRSRSCIRHFGHSLGVVMVGHLCCVPSLHNDNDSSSYHVTWRDLTTSSLRPYPNWQLWLQLLPLLRLPIVQHMKTRQSSHSRTHNLNTASVYLGSFWSNGCLHQQLQPQFGHGILQG